MPEIGSISSALSPPANATCTWASTFGARGSFSGGGYNTHKALEQIAKQGLSCALFAPGWVFEHEFDCIYSPEYVRKEADFWQRTLLSVTESGRMCLTQSPTCVTFFVRSVVWAEV